MSVVRRCTEAELPQVLTIINAAAQAYRGVIPADRWHEPYMSKAELRDEIASGVIMWGYESEGRLVGVMGIQCVQDVELIRHAYVAPDRQRGGVGAALIAHLRTGASRRMLVGTWAAARWAISFYERHGFTLVSKAETPTLLRKYWNIPEQQIATSVVLANPTWQPASPDHGRARD
jgi:N-acetylglutamate synthase-like GNAT family acetyltransferase